MICPYKCFHCHQKLKLNKHTYTPPSNYPLKQFDCPRCLEKVWTGGGSREDSKYCIAYESTPESRETGIVPLYAVELWVEGYRMLIQYNTKHTFISQPQDELVFTTGGAMKVKLYTNLVTIKEVVKIDLEDKDSVLAKIKLLLTFS